MGQPFILRFLLKILNLYLMSLAYLLGVMLKAKVDQPIAYRRKRMLQLAAAVVVLGLIGTTVWSLNSYRQARAEVVRLSSLKGQQEVVRQEADVLLEQVRAHLVLPEDEEPTIATISDVEVLAEQQPFFEGAQNGDKVLVYVQARKAIIYSPERDVVVNVGAVIVDESPVAQDELDEATEAGSGQAADAPRSDQVVNEQARLDPAERATAVTDSRVLGDQSKSDETTTSTSSEQEQNKEDSTTTEQYDKDTDS